MTKLYRNQKDAIFSTKYSGQNILPLCETFDSETVAAILAQPSCTAFRIYYGMDDKLQVHAILVGVNAKGQDILPAEQTARTDDDDGGLIAERVIRCPEICPLLSPLNG